MTAGSVGMNLLPVEAVDAGGSQELYRVRQEDLDTVVRDTVPGAVPLSVWDAGSKVSQPGSARPSARVAVRTRAWPSGSWKVCHGRRSDQGVPSVAVCVAMVTAFTGARLAVLTLNV